MRPRLLNKTILSPLQYFGSRYNSADEIFRLLKSKKDEQYECFYDLFSGCGSLGLEAINQGIAKRYIINDAYVEFTKFWEVVRDNAKELIESYQGIVLSYHSENDYAKKQLKFYEIQNEFNSVLSLNNVERAAYFSFILNHSKANELKIQNGRLICEHQLESKISLSRVQDEEFANKVYDVADLFHCNSDIIQFTAFPFQSYVDKIRQNDCVILDPPYPCTDDLIYFRPEDKSTLKNEIDDAVEVLGGKEISFLMFYEVVGKEFTPTIIENTYHFLHLAEVPGSAFPEYVENIFISPHLMGLLARANFSHPKLLPFNEQLNFWHETSYEVLPDIFRKTFENCKTFLYEEAYHSFLSHTFSLPGLKKSTEVPLISSQSIFPPLQKFTSSSEEQKKDDTKILLPIKKGG